MATQSKTPLSLHVTRTMVWGLVVVYSGVLVGRSMYQNFSMNREIVEQKNKIAQLETKKRENQLALIYYTSTAFREIEARRRLNLRGPDEHVVVLKKRGDLMLPTPVDSTLQANTMEQTKPWQTWWSLFFGQNKKTPKES